MGCRVVLVTFRECRPLATRAATSVHSTRSRTLLSKVAVTDSTVPGGSWPAEAALAWCPALLRLTVPAILHELRALQSLPPLSSAENAKGKQLGAPLPQKTPRKVLGDLTNSSSTQKGRKPSVLGTPKPGLPPSWDSTSKQKERGRGGGVASAQKGPPQRSSSEVLSELEHMAPPELGEGAGGGAWLVQGTLLKRSLLPMPSCLCVYRQTRRVHCPQLREGIEVVSSHPPPGVQGRSTGHLPRLPPGANEAQGPR